MTIHQQKKNVNTEDDSIWATSFTQEEKEEFLSLEEIVERGASERDKRGDKDCRIDLHTCPELVKSSILFLRKKHERLTNISSVCRYTSKCGYLRIQDIDGLKAIEQGFKKAYVEGTELERAAYMDQVYRFEQRLGIGRYRITTRFFEWVHGGVSDLSNTLGLEQTTLTTIALVFGLASSSKWIPSNRRIVFENEAEKFKEWVIKRAQDLSYNTTLRV